MAIGGFSGGDPAPTLEHFIQLVRQGKVRYFVGGGMGGGFGGGRGSASAISTWAQQNGVAVSTSRTGGVTVYDLSGAAG